jgi:acylpyruvate hydrolase
MKIIRFHSPDGYRLGVLTEDGLADLSELRTDAPRDIAALLKLGPPILAEVETLAKAARSAQIRPLEQVRVALPIANPSKFICLGLNYQDHVAESKNVRPQYPTLFLRTDFTRGPWRLDRTAAGFGPTRLRSRARGHHRPPPA